MTELLFVSILISSAFLSAYLLRFTEATLYLGKKLSSADSKTGFQDAITPPWKTRLHIFSMILTLVIFAYGIYLYGVFIGLGLGVFRIMLVALIKVIVLPNIDSSHYEQLIFRSMTKRYADFTKNNDLVRAEVMSQLLERYTHHFED